MQIELLDTAGPYVGCLFVGFVSFTPFPDFGCEVLTSVSSRLQMRLDRGHLRSSHHVPPVHQPT